ncbi:MAG: hypothetical protein Q9159_003060 [Coniocarpon cinnabarinum]
MKDECEQQPLYSDEHISTENHEKGLHVAQPQQASSLFYRLCFFVAILTIFIVRNGLTYRSASESCEKAFDASTSSGEYGPVYLPQKTGYYQGKTAYSGDDLNATDAVWDAFDDNFAVVAIDHEWATLHGWAHSLSLPSDPRKSVYLIEAYHQIHCLKMIRQALRASMDGVTDVESGCALKGSARKVIGYPQRHTLEELQPQQVLFEKVEFTFNLMQTLAIGFIKLSLMFFYRRIFTGKLFNLVNWATICITAAWTVAFLFGTIFACGAKFWANWGSTADLGYCDNTVAFFAAMAISEFILDWAVMLIPLFWIGLQRGPFKARETNRMPGVGLEVADESKKTTDSYGDLRSGKLSLAAMLESSVSQAPPTRFVSPYRLNKFNGLLTISAEVIAVYEFWTYVEIGTGMVLCSLPTLKPLFEDVFLGASSSVRALLIAPARRRIGSSKTGVHPNGPSKSPSHNDDTSDEYPSSSHVHLTRATKDANDQQLLPQRSPYEMADVEAGHSRQSF